MMIRDISVIPLPGKQAELVAAVKEVAAHLDEHQPVASPRTVTADLIDGRVHLLTQRDTLDAHEAAISVSQADADLGALLRRIQALTVPGFWRWAYTRVC